MRLCLSYLTHSTLPLVVSHTSQIWRSYVRHISLWGDSSLNISGLTVCFATWTDSIQFFSEYYRPHTISFRVDGILCRLVERFLGRIVKTRNLKVLRVGPHYPNFTRVLPVFILYMMGIDIGACQQSGVRTHIIYGTDGSSVVSFIAASGAGSGVLYKTPSMCGCHYYLEECNVLEQQYVCILGSMCSSIDSTLLSGTASQLDWH